MLMCIFLQGPTQRDTSVPHVCLPKEKRSPRPMCHPSVSSGVYKIAESVLQKDSEFGSDGRGLKDLLSQVNSLHTKFVFKELFDK